MSKPILFLVVALSFSAAPDVAAQAASSRVESKPAAAVVARMTAVTKSAKGKAFPRPTAAQRARASKLVEVTMPNGERRLVRPKKSTN